jgi:hypothetical protein
LDEGDSDDNDYSNSNAHGIVHLSHQQRNEGRRKKEQNQRVLELFDVLLPEWLLFDDHKFIGTKDTSPVLCFLPTEAFSDTCLELPPHLIHCESTHLLRRQPHARLLPASDTLYNSHEGLERLLSPPIEEYEKWKGTF